MSQTIVDMLGGGPAGGSSLNITASGTPFTLAGTANKTYTLPATDATLARTDAAQSFTGLQTLDGSGTSAGVKFGATASAQIYVTLDTTAGVFTIKSPAGSGGVRVAAHTSSSPAVLAGNGATGVRLEDSNNGGVNWAFSTSDGSFSPSSAYSLGSSTRPISTVYSSGGATPAIRTTSAVTSGAGAATGTLTDAPSAGNPTKWIPFNDNGTVRYFPAW